ncbi:MAG: hypothetical protein COY39_05065 [Alphaproteobacteria bacterium CG_4_10_14_0_8_um_filter_37_21]|nr:MAG: hypothetical protein COY39_05065 [Alphaproteobacteria bacterium CG_4_10_14_0_8_um_filter_37_21]
MRNIFKVLKLTTALTISSMASETPVVNSASPIDETSEWVVVPPVNSPTARDNVFPEAGTKKMNKGDSNPPSGEDISDLLTLTAQSRFMPSASSSEELGQKGPDNEEGKTLEIVEDPVRTILIFFFEKYNVSTFEDVSTEWNKYTKTINTIISNLRKQQGVNEEMLTEKTDALEKSATLVGKITAHTFDALKKQYSPSSD